MKVLGLMFISFCLIFCLSCEKRVYTMEDVFHPGDEDYDKFYINRSIYYYDYVNKQTRLLGRKDYYFGGVVTNGGLLSSFVKYSNNKSTYQVFWLNEIGKKRFGLEKVESYYYLPGPGRISKKVYTPDRNEMERIGNGHIKYWEVYFNSNVPFETRLYNTNSFIIFYSKGKISYSNQVFKGTDSEIVKTLEGLDLGLLLIPKGFDK